MQPDDFESVEGGGIHLLPKVFGRTLRSWEAHWVQQEQERVLEEWLGHLTEVIREWSPQEPEHQAEDDL